jgi:nitroreductase
MELFECIASRRSIRRFTGEPVSEGELRRILQAGIAAPSAGNMQAREFVLVRSPENRRRVAAATNTGITARGGELHQNWVATAEVIVVICFEEKRMAARYGEKGRRVMTLLDCMGVAENMMLAVTALGLGTTCVIGFDPQQLEEAIPIPPGLTPCLLLPIGRPAEAPGEVFRFELDEVIRGTC